MSVSKRLVAREWLIFLALFCLGCPVSFFLGGFQLVGHRLYWRHYWSYDDFWNHGFGLDNPRNLALWLVPYLAVTLIRSIWWSIKTLNISKRALYGFGICIAAVVAGAVTMALLKAAPKQHASAAPGNPFADLIPAPKPSDAATGSQYDALLKAAPGADHYVSTDPNFGLKPVPFHGIISAVDAASKTFTIAGKEGPLVFKVTDKTVITKSGKAGTMKDIAQKQYVNGSYWKQPAGAREATTLNLGSPNVFDRLDEPIQ